MSLGSRAILTPGTELKDGAYVVGPVLGHGGFSITYSGHERHLGAPVAIKEFFPKGCTRDKSTITPGGYWQTHGFRQAMQSFLHEGRTMERFERPGIVKVYSAFEENGTAYMVMEFLQGDSLASLIKTRGILPLELALDFAARVGETLEGIHAAGLVHGDVKPENIMLTRDQRVVLLDFGAARNYLSGSTATLEQAALTPGYAPPEQYLLESRLGPCTDVYALAATLYHLLGGQRPTSASRRLDGEGLVNLRKLNPKVTRGVADAIRRGLSLNPASRPSSVKEFLGVLLGRPGERLLPRQSTTRAGGREIACLEGPQGWILALAFSPDGSLLASGSKDGKVWLWSMAERKALGVLELGGAAVNAVEISPDGKLLLCAGQDGNIQLFELASGKRVALLKKGPPPVQCVGFAGPGDMLLGGRTDGQVEIYGPPGALTARLVGHTGPVNAARSAPGGRIVATASNDKTIRLWELKSQNCIRVLEGHERVVQTLDFSRDGKLLASGSNDFSIRLWDPSSGNELRKLKGHEAMVWTVLFTPDRNILASCAGDKTIRLWRIDTAREVARLEGHASWVRGLACAPDRPLLASGGGDNTIRLWAVDW